MRRHIPLLSLFLMLSGSGWSACSAPQVVEEEPPPEIDFSAGRAWVRFVHAIPDGPAFEAWFGQLTIGEERLYREWTDWIPLPVGTADLALRQGEFTELSEVFTLEPNTRYLVVAWGVLTPMGNEVGARFLIYPEPQPEAARGDSFVRLVNAVVDGEPLGLAIITGGGWNLPVPNQPIGSVSAYRRGPRGLNTMAVIKARDTRAAPVREVEQQLEVGQGYTFVVCGRRNVDRIEVLVLADSLE